MRSTRIDTGSFEQVLEHRLDAILDPQTQAAATIGGYTEAIGELPWAMDRPHRLSDFAGRAGRERIAHLGDFAVKQGFTQILAPTHLLQDGGDPWLARDIEVTEWLRAHLDRNGATGIQLVYSLAVSYSAFRNRAQRRSLFEALRGVPAAAIWLKLDGFGSSSTPTAARTYIEAAVDFHELGIPVIGDHVGGLVGLGLLAFGAVSGIARGVTLHERFDSSHWRKERQPGRGYRCRLACIFANWISCSSGTRHVCCWRARRAPEACSVAVIVTVVHATLRTCSRTRPGTSSIGALRTWRSWDGRPSLCEPKRFLERHLRPTTDHALAAANINWPDEAMAKKTRDQRKRLDALRVAFSHQWEAAPPWSFASVPLRRAVRDGRG